MERILDGKSLSKQIEADLKERIDKLKYKVDRPVLATIIVGEDPASQTYVRMKGNACIRVGIIPRKIELPETITTEELLNVIEALNNDTKVTGILLQHPVPKHIDERACFNAIAVHKDVDGVNTDSFGLMANGLKSFVSCTPLGIMKLLEHYKVDLTGSNVVIVGRSQILGLPLSMLMLKANANIIVCHSKTDPFDLVHHLKNADVIVGACGIPHFIKPEQISEGVILIDAGYKDGLGDIDPACYKKAEYYTPVPGGVGPMTIASLLEQTVIAKEQEI